MRVVADTNVWVSGSILPRSVPGEVLRAVRQGRIEAVVSWELADEIARVMRRPKLRRSGLTSADVDEVLGLLAPMLPTVEFAGPVRDGKDRMVVSAALSGDADAIVTGDRDLLDDQELRRRLAERGIRILTPRELLSLSDGVSEERGRYAARRGRYRVGAHAFPLASARAGR